MSSREYLNDNSHNRPDIHQRNIRTIRFKQLFSTYEEFKSKLLVFGFKDEYMSASDFMIIETMIANSYLRYKTDVKNLGHIVFEMKRLYARKLKDEKLYQMDINTLLDSLSDNEQKFYTINKTEQGTITDTFLDNSVRSTLNNRESVISQLDNIQRFNEMELPELSYLSRLVNSILYPLQPTQTNRGERGKYDY